MARLFELENDKIERDNKVRGIIISVAFHLVLGLILFYIIGVSQFNPPLQAQTDNGGVMVNLGFADDGKGTVQPTNTDDKIEVPQHTKPTTEPPVKSTPDNVITSNITDAPLIAKEPKKKPKKEIKPVKKTPVATVVTKTPTVVTPPKPKATFHYNGGTQNNSPGEGNGTQAGDKGQTNGSPNGNVYAGNPGLGTNPDGSGGFGNGSAKVPGRRLLSGPCKIKNNSQDFGTIALKITVDKNGNITNADGPVQGHGSTTLSSVLTELAKKSVSCCKFDAPANVPPEQSGYITFVFKPQ